MKMSNGMGSVYKLSGNRRKPWIARKTKGWLLDPDGQRVKQEYITIGYYETKQAALTALVNYNACPYDIDAQSITFSECYEKWAAVHFENIVTSAQRTWKSAYSYCSPLYNMRMRDIRVNHLESVIRDAKVGAPTKQRIKSLFNLMYKYALKMEIVDKNYAALCDSVKRGKPEIERIVFTTEEIEKLKALAYDRFPFAGMVLIGIYSGWRPQELAILKICDVDIDSLLYKGGLKTEAGKNRLVPIHSAVKDLVIGYYNKAVAAGREYLFIDPDGSSLTYDKYRRRFTKVCQCLGSKHTPHDTRHTFITLAKAAGVDDYALKLIVGHNIDDVTESVYNHRNIETLRVEIEKIK